MKRRTIPSTASSWRDDPLWFKDAVIYEVYVRAFHDSNGDGIGDFQGLTEKLDYLQDLGVTALWLLPFYPSPLRDGGYDIADYTNVHPDYGTKDDFLRFLHEAHRRGLRVITELVLNHTSSEHAWFQRARRAPAGSPERSFYVWSDTPERYRSARIIFQDFESSNWAWDPIAKAYYWHRFYAHQPDLNFDNPAVHEAMLGVVDHWFGLGVDGVRLDAIPYLYEAEGTSCENLPETHAFLKKLRKHVDARHANRMLLAEANQWPADAAAYFGEGDECHMNFHFPLMPRLFMAVHLEDAFPIVDILDQTPPIPASCQWATFLRNHDELTLEMVTEEDRDYMYRVYAEDRRARLNLGIRRRLAPLLRGRRRIELMNALLFSLPGTPFLYYGDELGMGDNIYLGDRDGVRTPMQWNSDRNAGFSRANPQRLYLPVVVDPEFHYEALNVEAQQANPSSLLWWTKRLIAQRKRSRVLSRGDIRILSCDNGKVLAFLRTHGSEQMLCVANLSRFVQHATLDVSGLEGAQPVEAFGRTRFPRFERDHWEVALGSHGFYWFALETPAASSVTVGLESAPLHVQGRWFDVVGMEAEGPGLERLVDFVTTQRWYRSKSKTATGAKVRDVVLVGDGNEHFVIVLLDVEMGSSAPLTYVVPLAFTADPSELLARAPLAVAARLVIDEPDAGHPDSGVVYDALASRSFARWLLRATSDGATLPGAVGALRFVDRDGLAALSSPIPEPRPVELDQSNSVVFYGTQLVLKMLRVVDDGPNNEEELTHFLTERSPRRLVPRALGVVEYRSHGERAVLGLVSEYVANQGTAWIHAMEAAHGFLDRVLVRRGATPSAPPSAVGVAPDAPAPDWARELVTPYPALVELLARRTAELHILLASVVDDPAFAPEPFTPLYQQSIFQSARTSLVRTFSALRRGVHLAPASLAPRVAALLEREDEIEARLADIVRGGVDAQRSRIHGDYHLAQVLFTGDDFVILDFEGEPLRPLSERRFKRCPLRDVAGMLRSFDYAAEAARHLGRLRPEDAAALEPWARAWSAWMGTTFTDAYVDAVRGTSIAPGDRDTVRRLLRFYLLDKCIYEIGYELDNRPDKLAIPITGLEALLSEGAR